ncbi:MAG TPA: prepilin-type N-terminal cleavage/methylation domain-containing protein [Candidatus Saccharimonadales bacterium]
MKGGKNRQPLGYTIIEVMIVLAVSGVMFLIAASFINGKQARSAFTAGVNDMASQIQDTVEQVTDGKYSDIPLSCSTGGGNLTFPVGGAQGTNSDCVFLGKLFRFTTNSPNYTLSSLAGKRSIGDVTPTISPGAGDVDPTIIPLLSVAQTIPQSLNVTGISVTDATSHATASNTYYVFGFAQSLGSSDGSFEAGGQTISLIYSQAGSGAVDSAINDHIGYAQAVTLCLSDGNQQARLVLGGAGSQFNVDVQRLNPGAPCP